MAKDISSNALGLCFILSTILPASKSFAACVVPQPGHGIPRISLEGQTITVFP